MKKSRVILSIGIIIILSIINFTFANSTEIQGVQSVMNSLKTIEADLLEVNINSSGKIFDRFLNINELEGISSELKNELKIIGKPLNNNQPEYMIQNDNSYNIDIIQDENLNQIIINGKDASNKVIIIILQSYKDVINNIEETNLVIDITHNNELLNVNDINNELQGLFQKFNSISKITTCFIGTFDGKLNDGIKNIKITKMMNLINSNKVEGINNESLISISAYSSNINKYIYSGNKKVNLNIAMRYNEYEDKTYIWVGTPLISIAY